MFSAIKLGRSVRRILVASFALVLVAACEPISLNSLGSGVQGGQTIDPNSTVRVALLVPQSNPQVGAIAASLENAARLAISEQPGARIDLRVYDTAGNASTASAQAQRAVDEGAKLIIGPLFQDAVAAAGVAVVDDGVNVLGFTNNPSVAGGNVFILGPTFANSANRLLSYAKRQGKSSVLVMHEAGGTAFGNLTRIAVEQAAAANGLRTASIPYNPTVESVTNAAQQAGRVVQGGSADTIVVTADAAGAVAPIILQVAPENGATPGVAQYVGLTRWDIAPQLTSQPGAEGAWFAMPSQAQQSGFVQRYRTVHSANPHPLAGLAYDAVSAVSSLVAAGRSDAFTARALTRGTGFNGSQGTFRFLPNGTNQRALAIATIRNRQVVIVDPAPSGFGAGS